MSLNKRVVKTTASRCNLSTIETDRLAQHVDKALSSPDIEMIDGYKKTWYIQDYFVWKKTPQGWDFWMQISEDKAAKLLEAPL